MGRKIRPFSLSLLPIVKRCKKFIGNLNSKTKDEIDFALFLKGNEKGRVWNSDLIIAQLIEIIILPFIYLYLLKVNYIILKIIYKIFKI